MSDILHAGFIALGLIFSLDAELFRIVRLSLGISLAAVAVATTFSLPLGAALAVYRFQGRGVAVVIFNALMGLPPVVVGLVVYLVLSRSGPLGMLGLLFKRREYARCDTSNWAGEGPLPARGRTTYGSFLTKKDFLERSLAGPT